MAFTPQLKDGKIYCPLKGAYLQAKPEELVRQAFIHTLHEEYGYAYEQMDQLLRTQSGKRSPRIDIAVWASAEEKARHPRPAPVLVVECKAENVSIHPRDYYQGESYARAVGEPCEFLVMHNTRQTAFFRLVRGLPGGLEALNDLPRAADWGDAKRLDAIRKSQRQFSRKEFQDLLSACHDILRDVHKTEPKKAFDAISKVLFVKMFIERSGDHGTFTVDFLDRRDKSRLPGDPPAHEALFALTKVHYADEHLFKADDTLNISGTTFRRIVAKLQPFNLSATGDDVKGLAFERFLGRTFRGELGQFFTPRPVVDFMVEVLDPQERELVCDPCAGSGGFLIKAFEYVRAKIEADVQAQKDQARTAIEALGLPPEEEEARIAKAFADANRELVIPPKDSDQATRLGYLSRQCIFGTDAEETAARTAKMNMIMHGDGHGGIHYFDGLLDINGIFGGRFDVVLTNPPFGSTVGEDQHINSTDQTTVPTDADYRRRSRQRYGDAWEAGYTELLKAAQNHQKILDRYEIGRDKPSRATEVLFVERALNLLRPGGRLGVVLPDGNLNNPSLAWLRRWAEGRARLLAVVSLPPETFAQANASVKASLVFLQRFTPDDEAAWAAAWEAAHAAHDPDLTRLLHLIGSYEEAGRTPPTWRLLDPPPYPRGVVRSAVMAPRWGPLPKKRDDRPTVSDLRTSYAVALTADEGALAAVADQHTRRLTRALRRLDRDHSAALWQHVRAAFDYPVFAAAPTAVGLSAANDTTGPNDLPAVLADYRAFRAWVAAGADPAAPPAFAAE